MTNNLEAYIQAHYAAWDYEYEYNKKLSQEELHEFVTVYLRNVDAVNTAEMLDNR